MKKDIILQISNNIIQKIQYKRKGILKPNYTIDKSIIHSIDDFKVVVKNRKLFLLIENEEIYIKYLRVPKIEKSDLSCIIKNRLKYLYGKKSEEILYTYTIYKEEKSEIEILIFCANCDRFNILFNSKDNYKLNKITLIQLWFFDHYEKLISDKDCLFVFRYNKNIYLLSIVNKKIVGNKIIQQELISSITDNIEYILHKSNSYDGNIKRIYSVNLSNDEISKYIFSFYKYESINLGFIEDESVLEHFAFSRR